MIIRIITEKLYKTKNKNLENYIISIKKGYIHYLLMLTIIIFFFYVINKTSRIKQFEIQYKIESLNKKCYSSPDNSEKKILHLIITRFLIEFWNANDFPKIMYNKSYINNGIRVMKKYLFPSLENQSCKNFTWILMLGDKANINLLNSLIKINNSFSKKIIYQKDIKNYIRNITKGIDILITTRIDYDDRIYYDAVNDVRKAINIKRPLILYGYNRGLYYYEVNDKYYELYQTYQNLGVMSVFISLITVLKMVNETYTVYDLGIHIHARKNLLNIYKSFGFHNLSYDPSIVDNGEPKFVFVRQNYSGSYNKTRQLKNGLKSINFSLIKFYGK